MPFLQEATSLNKRKREGACVTIMGPPKTGKTTALGGLVLALKTLGFENALMVESFEAGHITLTPTIREQMRIWAQPAATFTSTEKGGVTYYKQDFPDAVDYGKEFMREWMNSSYLVNALDTASTYAGAVLDTVVRKDLASGNRQQYLSKEGVSIRTPSQPDYGNAQAHLKALFYELHCHCLEKGRLIVILAHERTLGMETEGGIVRNPMVGPQFVGQDLTREFPKVPHVIARTVCDKGKNQIWTRSESGIYIIGDRLDVLAGNIDVTAPRPEGRYEKWAEHFWLPILTHLNWNVKEETA